MENKENKRLAQDLLYKMILIREFENNIAKYKMQKKVYGMAHCCNGEEAIAVGICSALKKDDYLVSNHRPHGHAIAKGVEPKKIFAEIMGKETGTNAGRGGSMHINDKQYGMITSTGIVGSGIPIACGAAFSTKYKKDDKLTCVFIGDGATNEGTLHECLNLAAIWKLPLLIVIEDNGLAVTTLKSNTTACEDYTKLAAAYGIQGRVVNGQDVEDVYNLAKDVIEKMRISKMPFLIHAKTIRFNEHAEGEYYLRMKETNYRDNKKVDKDKILKCPIKLYENKLEMSGLLEKAEINMLHSKAVEVVKESIEYAELSPKPNPETIFQYVY